MKLWHSFIKELKLSSRGFYFYVEVFMAVVLLVILLFVIPENFENKQSEYIYYDLPDIMEKTITDGIEDVDLDGKVEIVEIESGDDIITARLYETEGKRIYLVDDEESVISLADTQKNVGSVVSLDNQGELHYKYYLQGYESERFKKLFLIFHSEENEVIQTQYEQQDVRPLSTEYDELTDRENVIPSFLTFNGSLMGLFIIAAYIFLDKQEGIIKAYAVTASSVWQYLMSKVGVIIVTSIITSLMIIIPVMGLKPNYILLLLFLITTGFFASSLGLLIASFYQNIMQAFGIIYMLIIVMILPNIAYFIPSWEPLWIKILPTYPMLEGFKEIILNHSDTMYVLRTSLGFLVVGLVLFLIANIRYKKTLTA